MPVAALIAVALAAAPNALAQSAGDEQYADPFGAVPKEKKKQQQQKPQRRPDRPSDGNVAASPAPPAAPQAASSATVGDPGAELPRTGLPVALVAALGITCLAGGALLGRLAARRGDYGRPGRR